MPFGASRLSFLALSQVEAAPGELFLINQASYDGNTLDVSAFTVPNGIEIGNLGTRLYVCGDALDVVRQYNLSTAYDLSTAVYSNKSISAGTGGSFPSPQSVRFNDTGSKMFVGDTEGAIQEFSLSTPWELNTASAGSIQSFTSQAGVVRGFSFSDDGGKLYVVNGATAYQYTLSTPYSITTASYDNKSATVGLGDTSARYGIYATNDGTKLFVNSVRGVDEFTMSTAHNLSTAEISDSFAPADSLSIDNMSDLTFAEDGSKMYVVDYDTDTAYQFDTSTASSRTPKAITVYGGAQLDNAQIKFGDASAVFDGNVDRLVSSQSDDFIFDGDFTWECFIRPVELGNQDTTHILTNRGSFNATNLHLLWRGFDEKIQWGTSSSGALVSSSALSYNTWHHLAIVRSGGVMKLYVNGTADATTFSYSGDIGTTSNNFITVGGLSNGAGTEFNGNIDEVRISTTARYTSNFTPSTSAFTNDANTVLLLHMNGRDGSTHFRDDAA